MKISIASTSVLFSTIAIGSFFRWQGERFQKTKQWEDNNQDNVLCLDAKRGSRFGNDDEVFPIEGKMEYVTVEDRVELQFVEKTVKFGDIQLNEVFLSEGWLYIKRPETHNQEGNVETNAYCYNSNGLTRFINDTVVEPRTAEISVA